MKKLLILFTVAIFSTGFSQVISNSGVTHRVDEFEGHSFCDQFILEEDGTAYSLGVVNGEGPVYWQIAMPYYNIDNIPFYLVGGTPDHGEDVVFVKLGDDVYELYVFLIEPVESIGGQWYQAVILPMEPSFMEMIVRYEGEARIRFSGPRSNYDFTFSLEPRILFSSEFFLECPVPDSGS